MTEYCKHTDENRYEGMACVAEKRIFNEEKIRDTALMAIDATAKIEDDDLGLMNAHIAKTQ